MLNIMPSKMLTLTIVIPAYNEQIYIKACLDSIASQTQMPDQVIVVDNNSSDNTAKLAGRYSFVTLKKENRQGVVFARNKGFECAASKLICRIDADTILPPDWVEKIKHEYRQAGEPALYASTSPSTFRNKLSAICYVLHRITYFWPSRLLMGHNTVVGSNMFITNELWQAVKGDVCLRTDIHEDMDLAYHIARLGVSVKISNDFKASIVSRKMLGRLYSYPAMMIKIRTIKNHRSAPLGA
jgi:glycosyltransferase involved in cell wall biosynthesis